MVLDFLIQTSKGGKQSITLPSYEAYKHSNNQNNTITFTRKPWYTYFGDNLQFSLDLRPTQQEREAMSATENQVNYPVLMKRWILEENQKLPLYLTSILIPNYILNISPQINVVLILYQGNFSLHQMQNIIESHTQ